MVTPAGSATLPTPPTPLIGREQDLAAAHAILGRSDVRLLTLIGPGGTGKTRLALALAESLAAQMTDGAVFVDLSPVVDPDLVAPTIAGVLDVHEAPGQPVAAVLIASLRDQELLLVLDNFEQVVDAAPLVRELLAAAPRLSVVVTSRVALRIGGEHLFAVPPLVTADPDHLPSAEALTASPAVALFLQRVRAVRPDFVLTDRNAAAVARVCARLDGLPLALELAAARLQALSAEQLAARLDNRFHLLTTGDRAAPARQQTLRATLDWSHDLLSDPERTLLRRLAVFAGGWTLEAAEVVCAGAGIDEVDVLDRLDALVAQSLVIVEERNGEMRYRLLETIREYGREHLIQAGEERAARDRHADYWLAVAEVVEPALAGPGQERAIARLAAEHDNLRGALAWSLGVGGDAARALRLAGSLFWFWSVRGSVSEGRRWLEQALAVGEAAPATTRAKALHGAGQLARYQAEYTGATALLEAGLALYRQLHNVAGVARSLSVLGTVAWYQGDYTRAVARNEESLTLQEQLGDRAGMARALGDLGLAAWHQRRFTEATARLEAALAHFVAVGDAWGRSRVLGFLGHVAAAQGDAARAAMRYEESLALCRQLGHTWSAALALCGLGLLAVARGDAAEATATLTESLALRHELSDAAGLAESLAGLAAVAALAGNGARAATLGGAAAALCEATGVRVAPERRAAEEHLRTQLRAVLGTEAFTTAWSAGRALPLEAALAVARSLNVESDEPVAVGGTPHPVDGLTPREREVLRLVAAGHSNREIADHLVVSERTVEHHIANIYRKIDARGRVDATSYALRHGMA